MANKRQSHRRAKPGSRSTGRYFHIAVRPAREFVRFRIQDVGRRGGVQRLAGQRTNGTWDTQKWLIEKTDAHIENDQLVADTAEARKVRRETQRRAFEKSTVGQMRMSLTSAY